MHAVEEPKGPSLFAPDVDDVGAEQLAGATGGQLFEHVPFAASDVQHRGAGRNVRRDQRPVCSVSFLTV